MPEAGPGENVLEDVTVAGTADVWAGGRSDPADGGPGRTLLANWDGSEWKLDSHSVPGAIRGLTATADGELWAAGSAGQPGSYRSLIERSEECSPAP